jgi:adenine-specific DNA methylase
MKTQMTFNFVSADSAGTAPAVRHPILVSRRRSAEQANSGALPNESVLPVTRPIHYLGSKLRIVGSVQQMIDRVDPSNGPMCDLFAGSGTVAIALSRSRAVTAVDTQEYSRVLCSALLHPSDITVNKLEQYRSIARASEGSKLLARAFEPMVAHEGFCRERAEAGRPEPLCTLLENGSVILFEQNPNRVRDRGLRLALEETLTRLRRANFIQNRVGLAARYFGGVYFSYRQACQLDMLLGAMKVFSGPERDTILAAILSTASDLVNTVGKQFAQPIRPRNPDGSPKPNLAERVARDRDLSGMEVFDNWIARYLALPTSARKHKVLRCDYREALAKLSGSISVVYADPPYTRDHYSRFYHVLETLCLQDFPKLSTVRIAKADQVSRGVYRVERHQSPFCIKSKASQAFSYLFSDVRRIGVPLVVSYSPFKTDTGARPRLVSIRHLVELAKQSFRSVRVIAAAPMTHSKLNRMDKNKPVPLEAESFVVCEP